MRLLHVLEATLGGTRRHVIDLLNELERNPSASGWSLALAYSCVRADVVFFESLDSLRALGIDLFEIPMVRSISPKADLACVIALASLIRQWKPDVVHMHSSKAGILGRVAARASFPMPKTVYTPHAPAFLFNRLYWIPEAICRPLTDAMIATSGSDARELSSAGVISKKRLHTIIHGIPPPRHTPGDPVRIRQRHGIPASALLVTSVGRLSAQKDPLAFVDIAARTCRLSPDVHFCWVGEGEMLAQAVEQAQTLGIAGKVSFVGFSPQVPEYLAASDIFVLTSRYESFGYVTAEAMAAGKPVVATSVAGTADLVAHGVTGFLVPLDQPQRFAEKIQTLAADAGLRREMGAAGRHRAELLFTSKRMADQHVALYRELTQ
jgi:glycosyltransferase involved in cell wall biosynthesis